MHRMRNIALVLMIGTLGVFLFPAAAGPFTTTNGPVTAFRAAVVAFALLLSMSAIVCLSLRLMTGSIRPALTLCASAEALLAHMPILRC